MRKAEVVPKLMGKINFVHVGCCVGRLNDQIVAGAVGTANNSVTRTVAGADAIDKKSIDDRGSGGPSANSWSTSASVVRLVGPLTVADRRTTIAIGVVPKLA